VILAHMENKRRAAQVRKKEREEAERLKNMPGRGHQKSNISHGLSSDDEDDESLLDL